MINLIYKKLININYYKLLYEKTSKSSENNQCPFK